MTGDEEDLFKEAMRDVAPLPDRQRKRAAADTPADVEAAAALAVAQAAERSAAEAASRKQDPNPFTLGEVPQLAPYDQLAWKKDGVQEGVYRNLRLGKYPLDASLDLHRHTVREARLALFEFLTACQRRNRRTVLVTHGRGAHSATPARLKSYVSFWLRQFPDVVAFHSAQRNHGGSGAVYVLLRKSVIEREINRERHGGQGPPG
jgi:DNA-nicking Smr family endonuclease